MSKRGRGRLLPWEQDPRPWAQRDSMNPTRLGGGADYEEGDRRRSIADARNRFLQAVAHEAPEVLRDLAGAPLSNFPWLPVGQRIAGVDISCSLTWEEIVEPEPFAEPLLLPLRDSLWTWAERWNLDTPWCLEQAVHLLNAWGDSHRSGHAGYLGNPDWSYRDETMPDPPGYIGEEVQFTFTLPWWDPRIVARAPVRRYVLEDLAEQVDAYFDAVEERARQVDMAPTPKMKRQADHFLWTALYQVKGLGWTDIARLIASQAEAEDDEDVTTDGAKPKDAKTIMDGVKSVSTLIGLKLRESN